MHFSNDGDVVWGTGVNGKVRLDEHRFTDLDVRAVRGPRTRKWLLKHKGLDVPAVYGDPALLLPLIDETLASRTMEKRRRLTVVPNMNEASKYRGHPDFLSPRRPVHQVVSAIASSEYVVGSSLHAIVLAEAFGVPCALVRSAVESPFKYDDYFEGTGRADAVSFDSFEAALAHAKSIDVTSYEPLAAWNPDPLIAAFPRDLWV